MIKCIPTILEKQTKVSTTSKKILHIVNDCGIDTIISQKDIAKLLNVHISTIIRNMKKMKLSGLIVEKKIQKNSRKYFIDSIVCRKYGLEFKNKGSDILIYNEIEK